MENLSLEQLKFLANSGAFNKKTGASTFAPRELVIDPRLQEQRNNALSAQGQIAKDIGGAKIRQAKNIGATSTDIDQTKLTREQAQEALEAQMRYGKTWDKNTWGGKAGSFLLGGVDKDGNKTLGANDFAGLASAGFGIYSGLENMGLARDSLDQKNQETQYNAQIQSEVLADQSALDMQRRNEATLGGATAMGNFNKYKGMELDKFNNIKKRTIG